MSIQGHRFAEFIPSKTDPALNSVEAKITSIQYVYYSRDSFGTVLREVLKHFRNQKPGYLSDKIEAELDKVSDEEIDSMRGGLVFFPIDKKGH